jgi:hypothetical protein
MSNDAADCRERAQRCARLAQDAKTPEIKATFDNLAHHWTKLAIELERESTGAVQAQSPAY